MQCFVKTTYIKKIFCSSTRRRSQPLLYDEDVSLFWLAHQWKIVRVYYEQASRPYTRRKPQTLVYPLPLLEIMKIMDQALLLKEDFLRKTIQGLLLSRSSTAIFCIPFENICQNRPSFLPSSGGYEKNGSKSSIERRFPCIGKACSSLPKPKMTSRVPGLLRQNLCIPFEDICPNSSIFPQIPHIRRRLTIIPLLHKRDIWSHSLLHSLHPLQQSSISSFYSHLETTTFWISNYPLSVSLDKHNEINTLWAHIPEMWPSIGLLLLQLTVVMMAMAIMLPLQLQLPIILNMTRHVSWNGAGAQICFSLIFH